MYEYDTVLGRRRQAIRACVLSALEKARAAGKIAFDSLPDFAVERPREEAHGDFAVNIAMLLARPCHLPPRDIARIIAEHIDFSGTPVERMEIAGPGFLNFRMKPDWLPAVMAEIAAEGADFGRSNSGQGRRVQVEFVSANPTGDLHMGNARGAAIGDSLAAILQLAGYCVQREFYINDAGNQIEKFSRTLDALYLQKLGEDVPFPEDGYPGADLPLLIDKLIAEKGDKYQALDVTLRREYLADYALKEKVAAIRDSLLRFGVKYDVWFSERTLHDDGSIRDVLQELDERGWLFERDGAIWLDCERFGEEKPEVVVRANGVPTYFAADIAYHRNKFQRGFATVIDIWGADHHGHVARMKGAMEAIGYSREQLEVILMQFVRLYQNGELVRMSKRTGRFVTLDELVDEVGRDAARFFFVMRGADSLIDFDMDLARSQSADNPVYYVQYAHARICSILRNAAEQGVHPQPGADMSQLNAPAELQLIRRLADYPDEIADAARLREPHRIATYLLDLAGLFHNFYGQCHCIVEQNELMQARLSLVQACAATFKSALNALGVSAPEHM